MSRVTKLVIGVPTYGNVQFTKMTVDHIVRTTNFPYELIIIVGKPKDTDTVKFCRSNKIPYIAHDINKGLPASINDIYDYAFVNGDADAVVIVGNDVLPFWNAIDLLVDSANTSDFDWISGTEVSNNGLIAQIPKVKSYFDGGERNKNFFGGNLPEWLELYKPAGKETIIDLNRFKIIGDSHNMCLFTRNLFQRVGYVDVNFYPAYFEDNDYSRRAQLAGLRMCRLMHSKYFHFWSRTLHQGGMKSTNDKYFPMNKKFYIEKWGGVPGKETFSRPYNGKRGAINITSRERELEIINSWINK